MIETSKQARQVIRAWLDDGVKDPDAITMLPQLEQRIIVAIRDAVAAEQARVVALVKGFEPVYKSISGSWDSQVDEEATKAALIAAIKGDI